MKKTGKTRHIRWLSCMVTLSLCLGSLGAAGAAPTKAEPELSTGGHPLMAAAAVPETVRELIGLEADAPQKVVQTDNLYEILTENEDGSGQGTLFAAPVKYIDKNGQAQFIDSSIVPKGIFRSLFQSYTYTNASNSVQVEYSKDSAKGVRLDGGITMAVADTKQPDDMPGFVREEAGKDDVFVYPQAFGPDTYVEYSNTAGGVKENIVLEKNVGRNVFAFTLETATHTPVLSADGTSITLVSKAKPGEGDYMISSLYVYDSYQPDGMETTEDFRHYTEDCLYRLEAVGENVYKITAVVSQAFLNHPETVYPVVIDPTISGTASTMDDAFISPTVTGASNYKASYLRVGKNGNDHYAFLRFGNLPSKPANVDVASATLKLTYRPNQTTGGVLDCYFVGKSWVGKDLTWANQPVQYAPGSTYDPQGRNYSVASFDVATHLQNWTNGGYNNYGLCISYNNLSMNDYNSVYSSDGPAASVPRIEYSYTGAYGATSGISNGTIYYLRNVRSGKYMDVQGDGYNVVQYPFHGRASQQWKVVYTGNGFYSLIPMFKQSARLDVANANDINGTNVGVWQENGNNAQQFRIIPCAGGCYRLQPKISTRKVLDVSGASTADNANVQIWDYGPARQHEWYLEPANTNDFSCLISNTPILGSRQTAINNSNSSYNRWPAQIPSEFTHTNDSGRKSRLQYYYDLAYTTAGAGFLPYPDASKMLFHYLHKSGDEYTVDFSRMVTDWAFAKKSLIEDVDKALAAAEQFVKPEKLITFYSTHETPHNNQSDRGNINWDYSIGKYSTSIKCTVMKRPSGADYEADIWYYLYDLYDFDSLEDSMGKLPVSPRQMWELHHGGYARNFSVKGVVQLKIIWYKGNRISRGLSYKIIQ